MIHKSKPNKNPQSYQKSIEYYKEVCLQDSFKEAVLEIQHRYFSDDQWILDWDNNKVVDFDTSIPARAEFADYQTPEIEQDMYNLLKRFELPTGFYMLLWYHVFCGLEPDYFLEVDKTLDVSRSLGLVKTVEFPEKSLWKTVKLYKAHENKVYPLAIKFSQYATKRDLLDYVNKKFDTEIKPIQDKHKDPKSKIGKFKSKKDAVAIRNEYIYELRDEPRKQIAKTIQKVYGEFLDVGTIGKIISLEKKRRKEV